LISQSTIDKVFEAARVEEVIGDFVHLKRSGSGYKALSPFTDEKTPSFSVSPSKQIWKDFSSGKGGNVVAFLMEHEHFTYPEAIRYLAGRYGIEIEETQRTDEEKEVLNRRENLYVVSDYACEFFERMLWKDEMGRAIGLSYFKERGFSEETIRDFRLGYCPEQRDAFSRAALERGYGKDYLAASGLSVEVSDDQGEGATRLIDRFRGRVMFPIFSMSGRVLGFGGRTLSTQKKVAKYINSPESEIYHKSQALYGLHQAKQEIARLKNCYLVEGYTDVIQLYQLGIRNVVASSGTALTSDQVRLIKRLTDDITLLYDGDAAGLKAAERGVDLILEQGMNAWVCTFPDGEDPDSFARKHSLPEVREFLDEHRKEFIFFKARQGSEEFARNPIKRAETARELVRTIACIPDMIKREVYIRESAAIMNVSEEALFSELSQIELIRSRREEQRSRRQESTPELRPVRVERKEESVLDVKELLELKILEVLVHYGGLRMEFDEWVDVPDGQGGWKTIEEKMESTVFEKIDRDLKLDEITFKNPLFSRLYDVLLTAYKEVGNADIPRIQSGIDHELSSELARIAMEEEKHKLNNWQSKEIYPQDRAERVPQLVTEILLSLRSELIRNRIRELKEELHVQEQKDELLDEITQYLELNKRIYKKLNRILS